MCDIPMKCYVVDGSEHSLQERPRPVPADGECLIRVLIAAVCNTDIEIMKGYMGFAGIVGHEFVGVVESAPEGCDLLGKRVVGDINLCCHSATCGTCVLGGDRARNHCPVRTVLGILNKDGTYAEYLTMPTVNLHVVPDSVSTENAAFMEPLAAACRIIEQGLVAAKDTVAVVGDGKLGLLIAEVLGRHAVERGGPQVVLVGRHMDKMTLVSSAAKIRPALSDEAKSGGVEFVQAATFDVVVEATGSPAGLELSRQLCRPMGTLVLKSTCAAGTNFHTAPFVVDELRTIGSRCGPFPPAMALLTAGLDLTPLITATYPLEQASEAVSRAQQKGCIKVQIRVSSDP